MITYMSSSSLLSNHTVRIYVENNCGCATIMLMQKSILTAELNLIKQKISSVSVVFVNVLSFFGVGGNSSLSLSLCVFDCTPCVIRWKIFSRKEMQRRLHELCAFFCYTTIMNRGKKDSIHEKKKLWVMEFFVVFHCSSLESICLSQTLRERVKVIVVVIAITECKLCIPLWMDAVEGRRQFYNTFFVFAKRQCNRTNEHQQ